jgi:hypothetical protein
MKRVSGYVVVNETGSGIPNLIVSAFDLANPTSAIRPNDAFTRNSGSTPGGSGSKPA